MTAPQYLASGSLIIAEPFLGDPNFERSVALICQHNAEGAFGLVLSQPTDYTLKDALEEEDIFRKLPLYVGGPVEQNSLHFIHRLASPLEGSLELLPGLFWGGNYEQIIQKLNLGEAHPRDVRFFAGYSGWGAGQLDRELSENAWIVSQVKPDFLFETPAKKLWREVLRNMGGKHKVLANYPTDPRLN